MQQFYIFKFDSISFRQFFKERGSWSGWGREESSGRRGGGAGGAILWLPSYFPRRLTRVKLGYSLLKKNLPQGEEIPF